MKSPKLLTACLIMALAATCLPANSTKVFPSYALAAKDASDQWYPVLGIRENKPLISKDGGLVTTDKRYIRCQKKTTVNDQFVEILDIKEVDNEKNLVLVVELKSSAPLAEPFALITFTPEGKTITACKYSAMDDLTGEVQKVRLRFSRNGMPSSPEWKLHFFHSGIELYDPARTDLVDATPKQAFLLELARHVSVTGTGDANPAPFFMPVSKPPETMLPPGADPVMVKVKFVITKSGSVADYSFVESLSKELEAHLSASVDQWLFFPRIKAGQLVEQTVTIPLKLR